MGTYLFVYGTLLSGTAEPYINRLVATQTTTVGRGYIKGQLYDLGPYPAAILSNQPDAQIWGSVLSLKNPDVTLASLDRYEGCQSPPSSRDEYERIAVTVYELPQHPGLRAWVYAYQRRLPRDATRIPSGDYLEFLNSHSRC